MEKIQIIDANADNICNYAHCGYKNVKRKEFVSKTDWVKKRFSEGMKYKILHSSEKGAIGFIEYIPGKFSWRAVQADTYMLIHCIMIISNKYQGKGYGSLLLRECIKDAKKQKLYGVAAVTSKGTFMAGNDIFLRNGFQVIDEAPPYYELLVKKFKKNVPSPKFKGDWDKRMKSYSKGITIIRSVSLQCKNHK